MYQRNIAKIIRSQLHVITNKFCLVGMSNKIKTYKRLRDHRETGNLQICKPQRFPQVHATKNRDVLEEECGEEILKKIPSQR